MLLTTEQRSAARSESNVFVDACPGSGKTRVLVAKLLRCVDEVRNTPRRVACITYTNPAVYEISERLRRYGYFDSEDYCDVATIHSFCLNNILRYFYWRLEEYHDGFVILPPDTEKYREIARDICMEYNLDIINADNFELLNREPDGTPITHSPLTPEIAEEFWDRLQKEQIIDFPSIIYYSYKILEQNPTVVRSLASRFAWILIDEFQDTSALQIEILKLIASYQKTRFFLVGDPNQSIFSFAGAHPELMYSFSEFVGANRDFKLGLNFRSSQKIINHAERLIPRNPRMMPGGDAGSFPLEPIYIHAQTAFETITDIFLPLLEEHHIGLGASAILAPQWFKLMSIGRQLRTLGIPIIGPGARPYRRSHIFAMLAEQVCAYLTRREAQTLRSIERELFNSIANITGCPEFRVYTYAGKVIIQRILKVSKTLCEQNAFQWLRNASAAASEILVSADFLPRSAQRVLTDSAINMIEDMKRNDINAENMSVDELGLFAHSDICLKLITMHRAKGREFDAVCLVDLHNGRIPHSRIETEEEYNSARRLLYVAMTRARKILMYLTDEENRRNEPTPFLLEGELGLVTDP